MAALLNWLKQDWQTIAKTAIIERWRIGQTLIHNDNITTIAGEAMKYPPKDIDRALSLIGKQRYVAPMGWLISKGVPDIVQVSLAGDDVYHILTSGKSRMGKDNAVIYWLLSLALQNPPDTLQLAIIDGKGGLDWIGWNDKAHTALLAIEEDEIVPAMQTLTAERKRRGGVLKAARCSNWEGYNRKGYSMPLLVVYIAELSLLETATSSKELEEWMNAELSAAGAFGIRYIVTTQTATNFPTRWRGQIDLFAAGYQPAPSHDKPNTGLGTKEIRERGFLPPSDLPEAPHGRGVFTLVQGKEMATVRVPYLDDETRQQYLERLPDGGGTGFGYVIDRGSAVVPELVQNGSGAVLSGSSAVQDEKYMIRELVESGVTRNQICKRIGGNKQAALQKIRVALGEE